MLRLLPAPLLLYGCCDLAAMAADLAGAGAVDCGAVAVGEDATAAWACAVGANRTGSPYVMRCDRQGADSVVSVAMVSDGARTWRLQQDSYDAPAPDIDGWDCVDPIEGVARESADDAGGYAIVECSSTAPGGNHYQVCGGICEACGSPVPLPFDP